MPNFSFLQSKPEYSLFSAACVDAEKVYAVSPELCAMGCRKGLELAVKWVYAADKTIKRPYKDNPFVRFSMLNLFRTQSSRRHGINCPISCDVATS